ncbi:MAG: hypothetical protein KAV00_07155 [Phycisphaerae bacterium]|nr:hypothetical protein [Phycisphaerae bacterium]
MIKALTKAEARKATQWAQRRLGITDWKIELVVTDKPPAWAEKASEDLDLDEYLGLAATAVHSKSAKIWVKPMWEDHDPLETLFHEVMHVVAGDVGITEHNSPHVEYLWDRLGEIMSMAYRARVK